MASDDFLFDDDFGDDMEEDDEGEQGEPLTWEQMEARREALLAKAKEVIFSPKDYALKRSKKRIAVVDTETDPFEPGLVVKPFALGFYDGERYVDFWGDDCVKEFFDYLATLEDEYIIYAHNGGKFDFFFFLEHLDADQTPLIMNGRLVKINFGGQEFRDSYAIIPQKLSAYKKDEIDYALFTRDKREKHRVKILDYMRGDCIYAHELISGFHDMFGDKLTIASASLPMLHSFTGFQRIKSEEMDAKYRKFYYGGRNQCFETGLLKPRHGDRFYLYDRNSMYPAVMRDYLHPISSTFRLQREIDDTTDFALITARNDGALPVRSDDGGLDFTRKYGDFYATAHEIRAGLETGRLRIDRVKHAWAAERKATFAEFVNQFYGLRLDAKAVDDRVRDILYKFCLNSGYGKFALNPRKFKQWLFTINEIPEPVYSPACPDGWQHHSSSGDIMIWCRPNPRRTGFYNVATAASITGAARANLLRNISLATRPIYCDTDSIICEGFSGELDETALGGWKLEASGNRLAIGGKKLYAFFDDENEIKRASKGVSLSAAEIVAVCKGQEITYANPVPNFALDGSADFVTRKIRMTA